MCSIYGRRPRFKTLKMAISAYSKKTTDSQWKTVEKNELDSSLTEKPILSNLSLQEYLEFRILDNSEIFKISCLKNRTKYFSIRFRLLNWNAKRSIFIKFWKVMKNEFWKSKENETESCYQKIRNYCYTKTRAPSAENLLPISYNMRADSFGKRSINWKVPCSVKGFISQCNVAFIQNF